MTIGYSNPVVESCQTNVLVYDRGGKNAVLTDASSVKAEVALNSAILTGSIGRTGDFLLITDEQGYRTAAAVYSTKGEELFKFSSSELYIVSGGLPPTGKRSPCSPSSSGMHRLSAMSAFMMYRAAADLGYRAGERARHRAVLSR